MARRDISGPAGFSAPKITTSRRLHTWPPQKVKPTLLCQHEPFESSQHFPFSQALPLPHLPLAFPAFRVIFEMERQAGIISFYLDLTEDFKWARHKQQGISILPWSTKPQKLSTGGGLRDLAGTHIVNWDCHKPQLSQGYLICSLTLLLCPQKERRMYANHPRTWSLPHHSLSSPPSTVS